MYKRILTIQDISCMGQCSLTVALPILSACGVETCVIPSAVLSTHTGGFSGYTFRDLTEDMPAIRQHWEKEGIAFDAVYTGYLGSTQQIDYVKDIIASRLAEGGLCVVDPAMADNGLLYPAFDDEYVQEMKKLCAQADIVLPNITEACFLTGIPYQEEYDEDYIRSLCEALCMQGARGVVLTGVGYTPDTTGVVVYQPGVGAVCDMSTGCCTSGAVRHYEHRRIAEGCHGTGDVYASAFVGALLAGREIFDAARIAADYTVACIENTQGDSNHWYGVKFETALPQLIDELRG